MTPWEVKALPIKTFWLMSNSVERIMAQKDMRTLTVSTCSQNGEAANECRQQLVLEIGTIAKAEEIQELDSAGLAELKELSERVQ